MTPQLREAWHAPTGTVLGAGVDVVDIDLTRRLIAEGGDAYLRIAWTPGERVAAGDSAAGLAARWAGKEAAMKALGIGIGDVDPLDVEVIGGCGNPPRLRLHGPAASAATAMGVDCLAVSLSHEGNWAVAFVVASGAGCGP